MTVTAARAEYIKAGFRTVDGGTVSAVVTKYGDAARKTTEPVPTFFESAADAQAMCSELTVLLSGDRRQFSHSISGEEVGLALAYSQTAPQCTVIDDRRTASHPAIISEINIDFGKQATEIKTWGGN
jgi:hypothetical protein